MSTKNKNKRSKRVKYPEFHNLYVILMADMNGNRFIKFGYSSQINKRVKTYTRVNPFCEVMTFHRTDAEYFELEFHSKYKSIVCDEFYKDTILDTLLDKIHNTPNFDFDAVRQGNSIPQTDTVRTGGFNNTGSIQSVTINNYMADMGNQMPSLPSKNK